MNGVLKTTGGAHVMMALWALLVGSSFPLAATFDAVLSPIWLTVVRFFIAAALMLPWVLRTSRWWPRTLRAWVGYTLLGVFLAVFFGSQFIALNMTSALSVAALFVTLPTIAWVLARLVGIERSGFGRLLVLLVGAVGALGLTLRGRDGALSGFGLGEWLFLAGCACSAAYSVSSRLLVVRDWLPESPLLATFWSLLIGACLMALLAMASGGNSDLFWSLLDAMDLAKLALLALFASFLTFWILQRAMQVLMPSSVAAYCYLTPLVSLALALNAGTAHLDAMLLLSLALLAVTVIWLIGSERGSAGRA
ncbi:Integral membrane protein [Marinobacterium lacunae]|uniref:Integral membrane protein n=1 Tax=Marinobacterium lacunae TaxID=1232683 RepID=A0A081G1Q1_9GAMM|nr:DMT family transporter [Marinobacterium lacunae]KEA64706.1 Integral membrane protein [Marinobacterium lacunae]MBR9883918.1 DMT family transporter [Oceanospirillales bacterium]